METRFHYVRGYVLGYLTGMGEGSALLGLSRVTALWLAGQIEWLGDVRSSRPSLRVLLAEIAMRETWRIQAQAAAALTVEDGPRNPHAGVTLEP